MKIIIFFLIFIGISNTIYTHEVMSEFRLNTTALDAQHFQLNHFITSLCYPPHELQTCYTWHGLALLLQHIIKFQKKILVTDFNNKSLLYNTCISALEKNGYQHEMITVQDRCNNAAYRISLSIRELKSKYVLFLQRKIELPKIISHQKK